MNMNSVESTVMVTAPDDSAAAAENAAAPIEERLAAAQREVVLKGEVLRWTIQMHGSSDLAYEAWKQAKATAVKIYSEVKAVRERLAVQDAA